MTDDITTEWYGDSQPSTLPIGIHRDVSDELYHADPCERPSLSASIAGVICSQSLKHARLRHPRMGRAPREQTDEMELGQIGHTLLLNAGRELETVFIEDKKTKAIVPADSWRTNAAKAARRSIREAGKIPVLSHKLDIIQGMTAAIREGLAEYDVILDGQSEVTIIWEESSSEGPVLCRGRLDHLRQAAGIWYDLKLVESASPKSIARHMVDYCCDIQHAAYTSALSHLFPEMAGRWDGQVVFCEHHAPHCVTPIRPDGSMQEIGTLKWERAKAAWARAVRENYFPGYLDPRVRKVLDIAAPQWAMSEELDRNA